MSHGDARHFDVSAHAEAGNVGEDGLQIKPFVGEELHLAEFDGHVGQAEKADEDEDAHGRCT